MSKHEKRLILHFDSMLLSLLVRNSLFAAVSDAIRTSLGPRGMDKMVRSLLNVVFVTIIQTGNLIINSGVNQSRF